MTPDTLSPGHGGLWRDPVLVLNLCLLCFLSSTSSPPQRAFFTASLTPPRPAPHALSSTVERSGRGSWETPRPRLLTHSLKKHLPAQENFQILLKGRDSAVFLEIVWNEVEMGIRDTDSDNCSSNGSSSLCIWDKFLPLRGRPVPPAST